MKRTIVTISLFVFGLVSGTIAKVAFAQGAGGGVINTFVVSATDYINKNVIPILVAIAVLVFFYNLIFFIFNSDNEKEREQFKKYSINSILALFILLSAWGIVGIFTHTFFNGKNPVIPQLPTSDGTTSATTP
jgi:heme/copper-type cytochrome/quinol oxidase subunit 4